MKVILGKPPSWIGPYQIAIWLQRIGFSEERCENIGHWLAEKTKIGNICQWIYDKRKRRQVIKIHDYDIWSMDYTLAPIIHAMLVKIKNSHGGASHVKDEDVPETLRSVNAPPKENEWDVDDFHFARWEFVLDEMIWAFDEIAKNNVNEPDISNDWAWVFYTVRMERALEFFGRYYRSLWT